jgi:hypothetical protein
VEFRILPKEFVAKARSEAASGKRALRDVTLVVRAGAVAFRDALRSLRKAK